MAEFPAIPLWTDRYLADTRHLTTTEHGAYLLLLMEAWRRQTCSLPDDNALLARLAGLQMDEWEGIKSVVMAFWKLDRRKKSWTQKTLLKERAFVARKSAVQRDNSLTRWKKTNKHHAMAMPSGMPNGCQLDAPTPTPTPTNKKKPKGSQKDSKKGSQKRLREGEEELLSTLNAETARAVVDHRMKIKKPLTARAAELLACKFAECSTPDEAANMMIVRGWQGFEPDWVADGEIKRIDTDWQFRLEKWRTSNFWSSNWGAQPGDDECLVPKELLDADPARGLTHTTNDIKKDINNSRNG